MIGWNRRHDDDDDADPRHPSRSGRRPLHLNGVGTILIGDCPVCEQPMDPEDTLWINVHAEVGDDGTVFREQVVHHGYDCLA